MSSYNISIEEQHKEGTNNHAKLVSPMGVIVANLERAGEVQTGTVGE